MNARPRLATQLTATICNALFEISEYYGSAVEVCDSSNFNYRFFCMLRSETSSALLDQES